MIKMDQNMLELWQTVYKKYINISEFCGFIVGIMCMYYDGTKYNNHKSAHVTVSIPKEANRQILKWLVRAALFV